MFPSFTSDEKGKEMNGKIEVGVFGKCKVLNGKN